jgi:hypothetical protein
LADHRAILPKIRNGEVEQRHGADAVKRGKMRKMGGVGAWA